jgi:HAD superfamily hydrolase (TIGR01490 family)
MARLAIFDLDGTLIPRPGAERRFARRLLADGLLGPAQWAHALAFGLRGLPRYGRHVWKKNKAYLAGLEVAGVERCADRFVRDTILPLLREALVRRLRAHQAAGDDLLLLTGTADFLARPLCEALGIAHCIATECVTRDGRFTASAPRVHPFGAQKLELARAFCDARSDTLAEATAYCDSAEDAVLLEAVAHPVAVDPDPRLALLARSRAWAVVPG